MVGAKYTVTYTIRGDGEVDVEGRATARDAGRWR